MRRGLGRSLIKIPLVKTIDESCAAASQRRGGRVGWWIQEAAQISDYMRHSVLGVGKGRWAGS